MPKGFFLLFCALLLNTIAFAQNKFAQVKDLKSTWQAYRDDGYRTVASGSDVGNSVHFQVSAAQYPNDFVQITSPREVFVFLDGKLLGKIKGVVRMKVDSLSRLSGSQVLNFNLYQRNLDADILETGIFRRESVTSGIALEQKPDPFFRDFVILSGLILIVGFAVVIQLHPKLAADYFSVVKILSFREGEDNQAHARIALSSNVLFYVFSSLLTALYLLIVFRYLPADRYILGTELQSTSFLETLWQWIKLGTIILALMFAKVMVVYLLSNLFGMRGIAGVHFFNSVRVLLVLTSSLSVVLFIYFISHGTNESFYLTLLSIPMFVLGLWIAVIFLKLGSRTEHSMFHLFSYICATEVIPLLLIGKILFQ